MCCEEAKMDPVTLEILKNAFSAVPEEMGAAIIEAKDSTTVVLPGMRFSVDGYVDIVIFK